MSNASAAKSKPLPEGIIDLGFTPVLEITDVWAPGQAAQEEAQDEADDANAGDDK